MTDGESPARAFGQMWAEFVLTMFTVGTAACVVAVPATMGLAWVSHTATSMVGEPAAVVVILFVVLIVSTPPLALLTLALCEVALSVVPWPTLFDSSR